MKEIKTIEPVYLEQYDIKVNPYLTYSQIQQIVNATLKLDTWAERQQNIDMLVMYHATDIGIEKLDELSHDILLESGVIEEVKCCIKNHYAIYEALDYTESVQRSLTQIVKELPKYFKPLEEVVKKHGNKAKK